MPSKLDFIHGLGILLGFSLLLNALGKLSAYGLSSASMPFPLTAVILGAAGVAFAIGLDLRYRYLKEKQKYNRADELELLQQTSYEASKKQEK